MRGAELVRRGIAPRALMSGEAELADSRLRDLFWVMRARGIDFDHLAGDYLAEGIAAINQAQ